MHLISTRAAVSDDGVRGLVGLLLGEVPSWMLSGTLDMASLEPALLLVVPSDSSSEIVSGPLPSRDSSLHHEADCQLL
jgi:hypothetical protein